MTLAAPSEAGCTSTAAPDTNPTAEYPAQRPKRKTAIRDASAEQPRLDLNDAPDADISFVRRFRDTIQIGPAAKRIIKARGIDAGHLKSFLTHFATYITRASGDCGQLCRRPSDMVALMGYTRSRFYELISAARELGYLLYAPSGTRRVTRYEVVHRPPVAATSSPGGQDASRRAVRAGRTRRATSSPGGQDASQRPTTTDQDDQHQHPVDLASRRQIRKACVLDRAAGRTPDEARYSTMTRADLWDYIAAVEQDQERAAAERAAAEHEAAREAEHRPAADPEEQRCIEEHRRRERRDLLRDVLSSSKVHRMPPTKVDEMRRELESLEAGP